MQRALCRSEVLAKERGCSSDALVCQDYDGAARMEDSSVGGEGREEQVQGRLPHPVGGWGRELKKNARKGFLKG